VLWVSLLALALATIVDVRSREIPDVIPIALAAAAVCATAAGVALHGWASLASGLALGVAVGVLLFWLGGFGGGDAKLLAALGAVLGPREFLTFLFGVAVAGGVFAAIAYARGRRDIAYTPAMTLGLIGLMVMRGGR
jgi:prepilin peptidase CpaA